MATPLVALGASERQGRAKMWKAATVATIVGLGVVATGLGASASEQGGRLSFCTSGATGCYELKIANEAFATVTGVNIIEGGCGAETKLHHSANLVSTPGEEPQYFLADLREKCGYRVVFKTTKGCGGDKDKQTGFGPNNKVSLRGGCGSLKVKMN